MALTQRQRDHLMRRLQDERARVLAALNRSLAERSANTEEEQSGDISTMPTHQADLGTDTMQGEFDAANETRMSRELAEIDDALERLAQNPEKFGICEDTGAEIPYKRLDIVPWARTCADAGA
jgi:RNA polymerase-binding transcription factor DksA